MKNPIKEIKAKRRREAKLRTMVNLLRYQIRDMEIEHKKQINSHLQATVTKVGYWKMRFEALDKEKDTWSEDARRLQDRIDTHEQLKHNEKFLGLVRAIKYINDFDIPENA